MSGHAVALSAFAAALLWVAYLVASSLGHGALVLPTVVLTLALCFAAVVLAFAARAVDR